MWSRNIVHDIYISINFRLAADCYLENLVDHILERTRQTEKQRKRETAGVGEGRRGKREPDQRSTNATRKLKQGYVLQMEEMSQVR